MIAALAVLAVALAALAWMSFSRSRLSLELSELNQLVADMLLAGVSPVALELARDHRARIERCRA
jgi:hypothetical protein